MLDLPTLLNGGGLLLFVGAVLFAVYVITREGVERHHHDSG